MILLKFYTSFTVLGWLKVQAFTGHRPDNRITKLIKRNKGVEKRYAEDFELVLIIVEAAFEFALHYDNNKSSEEPYTFKFYYFNIVLLIPAINYDLSPPAKDLKQWKK